MPPSRDGAGDTSPEPGDGAGFWLWRVSNAWQRTVRRALAPVDLTHVQFVLLAVTARLDTGAPPEPDARPAQRDIATRSGVDPMTTSTVLRSLERRGLVARARSVSDTRTVTVSITPDGLAVMDRAIPLVAAADDQVFAALDTDRDAFVDHLRELAARGGA